MRPRDQQVFKDGISMTDDKQLQEFGITMQSAKAQSPAILNVAFRCVYFLWILYVVVIRLNSGQSHRMDNGEFEDLDITPYSNPPDLPDVMKNQETNGQEQIA